SWLVAFLEHEYRLGGATDNPDISRQPRSKVAGHGRERALGRRRALSAAVVVRRVYLVRRTPEEVRHLLDDHDAHEVGEVCRVDGPGLDGAPVDHDRGVEAGLGGEVATERHAAALPRRGVRRRDVLDGELRAVQLRAPAGLEAVE